MKTSLRPVRRRIHLLRGAQGLAVGLLAGLLLHVALRILSFFVPVEQFVLCSAVLIGGCVVLGGLAGFLWPVSLRHAARRADGCGLKERAITALSFASDQSPMAEVQRADTEAALSALDVRAKMPLRIRPALLIAMGIMILVAVPLALVNNPQDAVIRERQQVRQNLSAQADCIEQEAKKIAEEESLTEEERQALRRITRDMAKDLREADDKRDALEKLDERQREMERLRAQIQDRLSAGMTSAMAGQSQLSQLAEAMHEGSDAAIDEALSQLAEAMQDPSKQQDIADALQAASEESAETGDSQQSESLAASASALSSGNASLAMSQLASAVSNATGASGAGTGANMAALMRMARNGVASGGQGSGQGQGQGQGSGQGSGGGGGSGSGQGQGGGGGAGSGSTNQDAGYTSGMSQSSGGMGQGGITDRVGNYEQIYDPTRLGGDSEASYVAGEHHDGEQQQIEVGPGSGDLTGNVPYTQVIGTYREAAAQAMNRAALPSAQKEWVDRYFNALID